MCKLCSEAPPVPVWASDPAASVRRRPGRAAPPAPSPVSAAPVAAPPAAAPAAASAAAALTAAAAAAGAAVRVAARAAARAAAAVAAHRPDVDTEQISHHPRRSSLTVLGVAAAEHGESRHRLAVETIELAVRHARNLELAPGVPLVPRWERGGEAAGAHIPALPLPVARGVRACACAHAGARWGCRVWQRGSYPLIFPNCKRGLLRSSGCARKPPVWSIHDTNPRLGLSGSVHEPVGGWGAVNGRE